jgi:hypothetical protein
VRASYGLTAGASCVKLANMTDTLNYVERVIDLILGEDNDLDFALAEMYALLVLVKGVNITMQDVHDAWAIWRNQTRPSHQSIIPFDELTVEVQELDRKYMDMLHRVAKQIFN